MADGLPTVTFQDCPHKDWVFSRQMAWSMGYNEALAKCAEAAVTPLDDESLVTPALIESWRRALTDMVPWLAKKISQPIDTAGKIREINAVLNVALRRCEPRSESVALNPAILPALPGQKALTVTMLKDDGDVQADAAIEAIKAGTSTFHVTNPSRLFFHHLRLRVALEPALADKIAVYYLTDAEDPNKRWRLVGLGKDDQLRWPPNFELDLWEKEAQISAVGGHPVPSGRAEEIATELRRKYGC